MAGAAVNTRRPEEEGASMQEFRSKEVYGDLYENGSRPLVVVLGGSKAGIPSIGKTLSDYLTSNHSVLLSAYFGVGSLPRTLERVPVEYFVNAVNVVREELRLGGNRVVLIGNSKEGEIALLLSKHLESIATIACVPGCYVFQGLPVRFSSVLFPKSSWSLKGRELPYVKFSFSRALMRDARNGIYSTTYARSIERNFRRDAVITLDGYRGKILLLSAENDRYWPSKEMCETLLRNRGGSSIEHIVLDLEGHHFLEYEQSINEIVRFLEKNVSSAA
jgi:hypothetical protein